MRNARFNRLGLLAGAILALGMMPTGASSADADHSFEIYGFAQADFIMDVGGRLDPAWDDAFRPSRICIDGACGSDGQSSGSV